ncbi:MAG TPA: lamin tail domain-containing protein [Verrucomicrobiales bacterium]|nr:lamin tail domain-containing protein [Verrucomicrobiales bacterium]
MISPLSAIRRRRARVTLPAFLSIGFLLHSPAWSQVISEFSAINQSLKDEDGEGSDWIEIRNDTAGPVNLNGWHLTDNASQPDRWTFPDTPLGAGQFLVVFASNKDRRAPGHELHTDFKLSGDGEYLALTRPDLTVATAFAPVYPAQGPDISYGTGFTVLSSNTLVSEGNTARYLVPADGSLGDTWTQASFQSGAWASGATPIGFGSVRTYADVVMDDGPLYYWNFDEASGPALNRMNPGAVQDALTPQGPASRVTHTTLPLGRAASFTGADNQRFYTADLSAGTNINGAWAAEFWVQQLNPTKTTYFLEGGNTSGSLNAPGLIQGFNGARLEIFGSGGRTGTDGPLLTAAGWHHVVFGYFGSGGNEGVANRNDIYVDGVQVSSQTGDFPSPLPFGGGGLGVGGTLFGSGLNVLNGQMDELAIYDLHTLATPALVSSKIASIASGHYQAGSTSNFGSSLGTNVGAAMTGRTSLYARHEFNMASTAGINRLTLRVRYDDGFAAWLNGTKVASANAPESPAWNSTALTDRAVALAAQFIEYDISAFANLLTTGTNVLALQGLNSSAADPEFLISAELTAAVAQTTTGYFLVPTPGAPNGTVTQKPGPLVTAVTGNPPPPSAGQNLVVTAAVSPALSAVTGVQLTYQVMYGAAVSVPMLDNGAAPDTAAGDGIYAASIPGNAFTAGQMIRWAVTASDADGQSTRAPAFLSPTDSPQYFGTVANHGVTSNLPIFEWFLAPGTEGAAKTRTGTRASVFFDGEFYDNVFVRLRGATAAGLDKNPYKIIFNTGHKFRYGPSDDQRVDEFDLNTTYRDKAYVRAVLCYDLFRDAGVASSICYPMHVRRNNAFFSVALFTEALDKEYLRRNGLDDAGTLYKANLNGFTVAAQGGYLPVQSGFEEETPKDGDWSDITAFSQGLGLSGTARTNFVFDNVDLPAQVNYMAAAVILQDADRLVTNFYAYRDTFGNGEWRMLPWDMDLTLGQVNNSTDEALFNRDYPSGASHPFYATQAMPDYRNPALWNKLIDVITSTPVFREMYVRRLRTLMDQYLKPAGTPAAQLYFEPRMEYYKTLMAADAAQDKAKWASWGTNQTLAQALDLISGTYLPGRRTHLFVTHNVLTPGTPNNAGIPAGQGSSPAIQFGTAEVSPASNNQEEEYFRLVNPNAFSVDISGWSIEGAVTHTFRPGTVIPAGGTLHVAKNVRAFRLRTTSPKAGEGVLVQGNYDGSLSTRGGTLELRDGTGASIASTTFSGTVSAVQQSLRITEVMYHPAGGGDAEYIELRNIGAAPLSLTGVRLSGGVDFDFTGSAITTLAAGARVLVIKDASAFAAQYGALSNIAGIFTGSLNNAGDRLSLLDATGEEAQNFRYEPDWQPITDGHGFSLVAGDEFAEPAAWNTAAQWRHSSGLNGSPGDTEPALPVIPPVVVNEILSRSDVPPPTDFIELHNLFTSSANIGGWFLTDDFSTPKKYRIPDDTIISSGGYRVFTEADFNAGGAGFALSSDGDEVYLFSADAPGNLTGYVHGFQFGAAENGVSFGLMQNSAGDFLVAQTAATPGAPNSTPRAGPVVFSEIHYLPARAETGYVSGPPGYQALLPPVDELEFIELRNISNQTVSFFDPALPANTWRLRGGSDFDFPPNITLAPGAVLLLVNFNPATNATALAAFRAAWSPPQDVQILGPYQGSLPDGGARLELQRPDTPVNGDTPHIIVDTVTYGAGAPWPASIGSTGYSLQKPFPGSFANDPVNWAALPPTAGRSVPPPVLTTSTLTGGQVNISFATFTGLKYQVEYSTELSGWQPLGAAVAGNGSTRTVTDSASPRRRFYRVSLTP